VPLQLTNEHGSPPQRVSIPSLGVPNATSCLDNLRRGATPMLEPLLLRCTVWNLPVFCCFCWHETYRKRTGLGRADPDLLSALGAWTILWSDHEVEHPTAADDTSSPPTTVNRFSASPQADIRWRDPPSSANAGVIYHLSATDSLPEATDGATSSCRLIAPSSVIYNLISSGHLTTTLCSSQEPVCCCDPSPRSHLLTPLRHNMIGASLPRRSVFWPGVLAMS